MLVISPPQIERLLARLDEPSRLDECRQEVARMLDIESALLSRATDMLQPCCGSLDACRGGLDSEVSILTATLDALGAGDVPRAQQLLREFKAIFVAMPR